MLLYLNGNEDGASVRRVEETMPVIRLAWCPSSV